MGENNLTFELLGVTFHFFSARKSQMEEVKSARSNFIFNYKTNSAQEKRGKFVESTFAKRLHLFSPMIPAWFLTKIRYAKSICITFLETIACAKNER